MNKFNKLLVLIAVVLLSVMVACKKPKPNKGDDTPKLEEVTFSNMITSMTKGEEFEIVYSTQENVVATFVSSDTNVATVENNKIIFC